MDQRRVADGMTVIVVDFFEVVDIYHQHSRRQFFLAASLDSVVEFGLDASVVVYFGERVEGGELLVVLDSSLHRDGRLVDILHHVYEAEVVFVGGLDAAEDELDPDIHALEVLHLAVEGLHMTWLEVRAEVLGRGALHELLLVFFPYHVDYHIAPSGVAELIVHCIVGDLGEGKTACGVADEVEAHGEEVDILDSADLFLCLGVIIAGGIVELIKDEDILSRAFDGVDSHLHDVRDIVYVELEALAVLADELAEVGDKDLILLGDILFGVAEVEPELFYEVGIGTVLIEHVEEDSLARDSLVLVGSLVSDYQSVDGAAEQTEDFFISEIIELHNTPAFKDFVIKS